MRLVLTLLAIVGALAAAPAAASAQRVEPVDGLVAEADSIVAGPDGAMWASSRPTPGGSRGSRRRARSSTRAPAGSAGFPVDADRRVVSSHGGACGSCCRAGRRRSRGCRRRRPRTTFSLSYGRPTSLADGPDGALWMTVDGGPGRRMRSLRRGSPGGGDTRSARPFNPRSIVVGPDRALWFAEGGRLGRITTAGES